MHGEPAAISVSQPLVPPVLDRVVKVCLAKEPDDRWQSARDLLRELQWVGRDPISPALIVHKALWRNRLLAGVTVALIAAASGYAAWRLKPLSANSPRPVARFFVPLLPNEQFSSPLDRVVALSPDGAHWAYTANRKLYLRRLDRLEPVAIGQTDPQDDSRRPDNIGPQRVLFSADGQWVGFWHRGELRKAPITGGASILIGASAVPSGPSWGSDGTIVYGQGSEGIWRIPESGGVAENIIKVDEGQFAYGPQTLPGGRTVLFTMAHGFEWDEADIVVQSLDTGARHVLVESGTDARYVPTGHLVYASGSSLLAVRFDPDNLRITGAPMPLVEDVAKSNLGRTGAAHFGVSTGALVYVPNSALAPEPLKTLVFVDRQGREKPVNAPPRWYAYPRLSPDGNRVALQVMGGGGIDIQILDVGQGTLMRLIPDVRFNFVPMWTADGQRVIFNSSAIGSRDARSQLVWRAADGSGPIERLTDARTPFPTGITRDGSHVIANGRKEDTDARRGLLLLSLDGARHVQTLVPSGANNGVVSPDGRWLAYESNESGKMEVIVRPFPNVGAGRWQISTAGGHRPLWAPNGRELFYVDPSSGALMSVPVEPGATWKAGTQIKLFGGQYFTLGGFNFRHYDVSPDGQRFLMIKEVSGDQTTTSAGIVVVQNWLEELKARVPLR